MAVHFFLKGYVLISLLVIVSSLKLEHFDISKYKTSPEFGVVFREVQSKFLPTDSYTSLIFRVPFMELPPLPEPITLDESLCALNPNFKPSVQETYATVWTKRISYTDPRYSLNRPTMQASSRYASESDLKQAKTEITASRRTNCVDFLEELHALNIRYIALRHDIVLSYQGLVHLLGNQFLPSTHPSHSRQRRALLGFLAPAFTDIFGLAQQSEIDTLYANMESLITNQEILDNTTAEAFEKLAVLSDITTQNVNEIWQTLNVHSLSINATFQSLRNLSLDVISSMKQMESNFKQHQKWAFIRSSLYDKALSLQLDAVLLRQQISSWTRSITRLINGYLAEEIISPFELARGLRKARAVLLTRHPEFHYAKDINNAHFYYSEKFAKLFVAKHLNGSYTLLISLKVPVTSLEIDVTVYQAIAYPVPLSVNGTIASVGYTKAKLRYTYFVLTKSENLYTQLTTDDFIYCRTFTDTSCPAMSLQMSTTASLSCLAALFYKNTPRIKEVCVFDFFPAAPRPHYKLYVSHGTFIISSDSPYIDFHCQGHANTRAELSYGIIKLNCGCAAVAGSMYIPKSLAHCNEQSSIIHVYPTYNAAQYILEGVTLPKQSQGNHSDVTIPSVRTPLFDSLAKSLRVRHEEDFLRLDLPRQSLNIPPSRRPLKPVQRPTPSSSALEPLRKHDYIHYALEIMCFIALIFIGINVWRVYYTVRLIVAAQGSEMFVQETQDQATVDPYIPSDILTQASSPAGQIFITILFCLVQVVLALVFRALYQRYANRKQLRPTYPCSCLYLVFSDITSSTVLKLINIDECLQRLNLGKMPNITRSETHSSCLPFCSTTTSTLTWSHEVKVKGFGISTTYALPAKVDLKHRLATRLINSSRSNILDTPQTIAIVLLAICNCPCKGVKRGFAHVHNDHFKLPAEVAITEPFNRSISTPPPNEPEPGPSHKSRAKHSQPSLVTQHIQAKAASLCGIDPATIPPFNSPSTLLAKASV